MELPRNSAHGQGPTCIAFSRDGSRIYTGGKDTVVRIWDTSQGADQEPEVAQESEDPIRTVAAGKDQWFAAGDDSEARRYTDEGFSGLITTTAGLAINCIAVNPKGNLAAVTTEELKIKIVDLEDILNVTLLEDGHKKGVRKATWHPSGNLLTTSGQDGNIVVWDVSGAEPKIVHTVEGVIPAVQDSELPEFAHDSSALWHTTGQYFFAATRSHEIVTISRATWARTNAYSDEAVSGVITALALSVNGVYLASATPSEVTIWSTATRRRLFHHALNNNSVVTQLAFSPTQNLLAWTDNEGALTRWANAIPSTSPDPVQYAPGMATTTVKRKPEDLFGMDTVATNGGSTAENDGDVDMGDMDDDWIIDDVPGGMVDEPEARVDLGGHVKEMVSITKSQPAFGPGSTPMDLKRRYLAYNMIGVIEVTDQDTHHIVNVEFHDRSARKGYHFTDNFKYNLGYLGERGALFACQPQNDHPAQVLYKPYGTWTTQGDWSYNLTAGVRVLGIAAGSMPAKSSMRQMTDGDLQGSGNVVVATSEGDLTFLSGSGRERRIMGLGADYITMVAGKEWVFVVHRAGSTTIDGSQNLSYTLVNFEDFTVIQRDILPIPKGHTLKWLGISDEGAPAIYDSTGRIHILTKFRIPHHASWARLLDTNALERKQGKDESYWPVGISGETFMCLILKGRQEHPIFPRPLIQELPVRMPFRRTESAKDVIMEEHVERETLLLDMVREALDEELTTDDIQRREHAMDKEFIQLIQAACKSDNTPRAIELVKLLHLSASFDIAAKVAAFYHLVGLQEKIGMLKADRDESDDRLEVARDKRKRWLKPAPVPRELAHVEASSSRPKPFQDFRPPPEIYRPGLQRATPRIETTRYTSVAPSTSASPSRPTSPGPSISTFGSPGGGKRKIDDMDSLSSSFADEGSKRRALDSDMGPPPKPKANPFARKVARKPEGTISKPLQKSESFFEKVDAAESQKPAKRPVGKGKEKEKAGKQQTTLAGVFGAPPAAGKKPKAKKPSTQVAPDAEKVIQELSASAKPAEDSMESFGGAALEQTQQEESQMEESQIDGTQMEGVETQEDESQLQETQPAEDNEGDASSDPMNFPSSPEP